jgi:membrane-associated phospholipid phosphatase
MWKTYSNLLLGLARDVTALGSTPFYAYVCLLFLVWVPHLCVELVVAFVGLMGISYAIKATWFKPRPDHVVGVEHSNVLEAVDASSFPSAHSARAAALAYLSAHFATGAVGWVLLLGALAVGGSRVALRRHTPVDVAGGFGIGLLSAVLTHALDPAGSLLLLLG